jgi:preprotein translocase subunit SecG
MEFLVWILHVLVAIAVVGLVLLQHGKGADMGAAFGSGASGSLFGATGSANFLSRTTAVLATFFFLTSMGLTYFSSKKSIKAVRPVPVQTAPQPVMPLPVQPNGSKAGDIPK